MATLTQEQTDFLKSHHIPMDKTFDASGLSSKAYKAKMKENGTLVAYGTPPCPKGHTLRNKQANCLQCNPHAVASIKRQATAGQLYIATAISENLLKISTAENASNIEQQLNQSQHAEISDWQIIYVADIASMGEIENQLQNHLADQQIKRKLTANSKAVKASEIYDIDIHEVLDLFKTWKIEPSFHNDNKIAESHNHYAQKVYENQQRQQRLADEQAERLQAEENTRLLAKQQEQQRLQAEQERAKQAKLEQKRQKQIQLDQQRQEKLNKSQAKQQKRLEANKIAETENGILTKTAKSPSLTDNNLWQKLTPTQWLMVAVGIFILLSLIIFALAR